MLTGAVTGPAWPLSPAVVPWGLLWVCMAPWDHRAWGLWSRHALGVTRGAVAVLGTQTCCQNLLPEGGCCSQQETVWSCCQWGFALSGVVVSAVRGCGWCWGVPVPETAAASHGGTGCHQLLSPCGARRIVTGIKKLEFSKGKHGWFYSTVTSAMSGAELPGVAGSSGATPNPPFPSHALAWGHRGPHSHLQLCHPHPGTRAMAAPAGSEDLADHPVGTVPALVAPTGTLGFPAQPPVYTVHPVPHTGVPGVGRGTGMTLCMSTESQEQLEAQKCPHRPRGYRDGVHRGIPTLIHGHGWA